MTLRITAIPLRDLGLRDAEDTEIFACAKAEGVILMTKDSDFAELVNRLGSPPKVIWLTCGNTSNAELRSHSKFLSCDRVLNFQVAIAFSIFVVCGWRSRGEMRYTCLNCNLLSFGVSLRLRDTKIFGID